MVHDFSALQRFSHRYDALPLALSVIPTSFNEVTIQPIIFNRVDCLLAFGLQDFLAQLFPLLGKLSNLFFCERLIIAKEFQVSELVVDSMSTFYLALSLESIVNSETTPFSLALTTAFLFTRR